MTTTAEQKYDLIMWRLQEVPGGDAVKAILTEGRSSKCCWGEDHRPARCTKY
ncbi:hypothetical protein B0H21DRAFT_700285 [Amylocystis lapponica]|nr:hypothetical protein B0H21DRAFT_700285 [Amylocystis lapponica]